MQEKTRLSVLYNHLYPDQNEQIGLSFNQTSNKKKSSESLTITDNRTGKTIEVPIEHGSINSTALKDFNLT